MRRYAKTLIAGAIAGSALLAGSAGAFWNSWGGGPWGGGGPWYGGGYPGYGGWGGPWGGGGYPYYGGWGGGYPYGGYGGYPYGGYGYAPYYGGYAYPATAPRATTKKSDK